MLSTCLSKSAISGRVENRHLIDMAKRIREPSDDLPNRIAELRKRLGLSMAELAERMGTEAPTVNKLEKQETQLTTRWMKRISEALNVEPIELLVPVSGLRPVRVVGKVQAGDWVEALEWEDPEDGYTVSVPDEPEFKGIRLTGLEVRGPSMDKVYPDRTVVIIASIFDTSEELQPGKRYVVERRRSDGHREGTVKTYEVDPDGGRWLVPESTRREFAPIPLDAPADDNGLEIQALGRVVWSVRRE